MSTIESSAYLAEVKPLLKTLIGKLLGTYPYASILACDCESKQYAVTKTGISISDTMLANRGFCAKVFDGKSYCEYSFTSISEAEIPAIEKRIAELVKTSAELPQGLSKSEYSALEDEEQSFKQSSECRLLPQEFSQKEIIDRFTEITKKGYALSDKIIACNAVFDWQCYHKLFISRNKDMEQNVLWSEGMIAAAATKGEAVKSGYKGFSGQCGAELLDKMTDGVDIVVKNTLDLLDSEPITPGEYDCVCTPEVTGIIAHEALGHGVEMDMFVKDRALAKNYIGKRVASDLVTMHDGAAAASQTATYYFDDEGVCAKDTVVINKGILERGISDSQSAKLLGTPPTANGRRESFERKAYTRMTNTFFEGGKDSVEDMIKSIEYGFLLDCPASGMEDPKNWGIQCMVSVAREIKDGRLTGKVFSPIVLTGYVPDLLQSISMMSPDVELSGTGFCGKGYKEWVKVSDGGPYIKAKIRLG